MTKSYILTSHAKERIRQRYGIESVQVATNWANDLIAKAQRKFKRDGKTHYVVGGREFICDDNERRVITVKPNDANNQYVTKLNGILRKEIIKILTLQSRTLNKAEIEVAQLTLNFHKARNPKTKASIQAKLTHAIDAKNNVEDEVTALKKAVEYYGLEAIQ
ncbi:hypothetical protein [Alkalihalobacillus pseudalcaliphilus]|uniref:hypothetical protein n=1 Tax=Alkalihalobacillus pseudalcaliphilus TaxID=79884 RepID=UPI00064D9AE6|nr:hypothetical protein [Alkalihalobacillus pseudalcaliphilus]KMK75417.1 hypothetical protein AB990_08855 [Alkalihalobacillus pseudalcaliphilus]